MRGVLVSSFRFDFSFFTTAVPGHPCRNVMGVLAGATTGQGGALWAPGDRGLSGELGALPTGGFKQIDPANRPAPTPVVPLSVDLPPCSSRSAAGRGTARTTTTLYLPQITSFTQESPRIQQWQAGKTTLGPGKNRLWVCEKLPLSAAAGPPLSQRHAHGAGLARTRRAGRDGGPPAARPHLESVGVGCPAYHSSWPAHISDCVGVGLCPAALALALGRALALGARRISEHGLRTRQTALALGRDPGRPPSPAARRARFLSSSSLSLPSPSPSLLPFFLFSLSLSPLPSPPGHRRGAEKNFWALGAGKLALGRQTMALGPRSGALALDGLGLARRRWRWVV